MRRYLPAVFLALACVLPCRNAWADHILNLELSGGAGVVAYNISSDNALAPPFVQFQASFLPVQAGPLYMGPALGVPLGFYEPDDENGWGPQVAIRAGWEVFHRPNVHFSWRALVGGDFLMNPEFAWGLEVGGSAQFYLTAGFALTGGLRYAFYYGVDGVHIISGQIGVMITYEVLR